jgi:hypothetical protein
MKTKIILPVIFILLGVVTAVGAVPDQPFMEAARADLRTAKSELMLATRAKAGYRAKAVSLVKQAIAQVNAGIAYARRHNHVLFPDQPHMQAALDALMSARNNLDKAAPDKGGHRAKAIDLVKQAIDKVQKGIEAGRS